MDETHDSLDAVALAQGAETKRLVPRPTLKRGISPARYGAEILILQDYLLRLGLLEKANLSGQFDEETERATKDFQLHVGLEPDGIVDEMVWAALVKAVKEKR